MAYMFGPYHFASFDHLASSAPSSMASTSASMLFTSSLLPHTTLSAPATATPSLEATFPSTYFSPYDLLPTTNLLFPLLLAALPLLFHLFSTLVWPKTRTHPSRSEAVHGYGTSPRASLPKGVTRTATFRRKRTGSLRKKALLRRAQARAKARADSCVPPNAAHTTGTPVNPEQDFEDYRLRNGLWDDNSPSPESDDGDDAWEDFPSAGPSTSDTTSRRPDRTAHLGHDERAAADLSSNSSSPDDLDLALEYDALDELWQPPIITSSSSLRRPREDIDGGGGRHFTGPYGENADLSGELFEDPGFLAAYRRRWGIVVTPDNIDDNDDDPHEDGNEGDAEPDPTDAAAADINDDEDGPHDLLSSILRGKAPIPVTHRSPTSGRKYNTLSSHPRVRDPERDAQLDFERGSAREWHGGAATQHLGTESAAVTRVEPVPSPTGSTGMMVRRESPRLG